MGFVSKIFIISRGFVKIGIVNCFFCILGISLVAVSFLILIIRDIFKCKSLKLHCRTINDNSFIKWIPSNGIFHSSNNLEFVLVDGAYMGDGSRCKTFILIFFNEGFAYILEIKLI